MLSVQHTAELVSLGLTIPTLLLSLVVVYTWSSSLTKVPKKAEEWFIAGVVIGFIGTFLDNFYWAFPWTASFLKMDVKNELINRGVYYNIFFRQSMGIISAFCHLKAAEKHSKKSMKFLNMLIVTCIVMTFSYSLLILYLR